MPLLLSLCLLFGGRSSPSLGRAVVKVEILDRENLLITAAQPIEAVYLDDMYENTDYMLDEDPVNKRVRMRLLTARGPLQLVVETSAPGTHELRRRHRMTLANPATRPQTVGER